MKRVTLAKHDKPALLILSLMVFHYFILGFTLFGLPVRSCIILIAALIDQGARV